MSEKRESSEEGESESSKRQRVTQREPPIQEESHSPSDDAPQPSGGEMQSQQRTPQPMSTDSSEEHSDRLIIAESGTEESESEYSSTSSSEIATPHEKLQNIGHLLFDENEDEMVKYRDTLSPQTPVPQVFEGIEQTDHMCLYSRSPISYTIAGNLGKGTYGYVFKAVERPHGGFFAIKVYHIPLQAARVEKFIVESKF
jgi:hypothetical protein